jgi:hypothetical protein
MTSGPNVGTPLVRTLIRLLAPALLWPLLVIGSGLTLSWSHIGRIYTTDPPPYPVVFLPMLALPDWVFPLAILPSVLWLILYGGLRAARRYRSHDAI